MNILPKELWLEIFEYLNKCDFISLTETCKSFNEMVLNTKLVEKLTLTLNGKLEWEGDRKYSQVKIINCDTLNKEAIKPIGKLITKLSIFNCKLLLEEFSEFLKEIPNVKNFYFSQVLIKPSNYNINDTCAYKNISIYFEDSSPQLFEVFNNSTAFDVTVDNKCSAQHVDFTAFKKFISSQKDMTSLGLLYFSINTNLFTDNQLDFVQFKLKKFSMNGVYFGSESVGKFMTFMLNHADSLENLQIQSPFMDISFFKQFSSLKELELSHTNAFFDTFDGIEKLTVENVSGDWMLKFPNVRELKMIFKYGVFLGMYADLVKLIYLKKLTIIDSKISELNISSVKKLHLKNVSICAKKPFRFEGNKIKELTLDSCNEIDWISDYLAQEDTRLDLLSIKNIKLIDLTRKLIEGHQNLKIKKLQFVNC